MEAVARLVLRAGWVMDLCARHLMAPRRTEKTSSVNKCWHSIRSTLQQLNLSAARTGSCMQDVENISIAGWSLVHPLRASYLKDYKSGRASHEHFRIGGSIRECYYGR